MKQLFGVFIREKRTQKMMKLNAFAKAVGISPVYESYIENGSRPAPRESVLNQMAKVLTLTPAEKERMFTLAARTRSKYSVPSDLAEYINEREYVSDTIRSAKNNNISEEKWLEFRDQIESKYE